MVLISFRVIKQKLESILWKGDIESDMVENCWPKLRRMLQKVLRFQIFVVVFPVSVLGCALDD